MRNAFVLLVGVLMVAVACKDSDGGEKDTDVFVDKPTDTDNKPVDNKWTVTKVDGDDVGIDAELDVSPSGDVGIAYFNTVPRDEGACTEVMHDGSPPKKQRYDLKFASKSSGGSFQTEVVDSPINPIIPPGLSFKYSPDGDPAIAYTGGDPDPNYDYCGAHDAYYTVKSGGTWSTETAAAESGDAPTGNADSDSGFGVGWYPALAFDPDGEPVVMYQDQHFVYLQRDDNFRADAELAWRSGGGWNHEAVDYGEGAGDVNAILFDTEDRPIVFFTITRETNINSRHGVWAARQNSEGEWDKVKIHTGSIGHSISAAIDPNSGEPVVAFYSGPDYGVKIRRLTDADDFTSTSAWSSEIVKDARYDEGNYVSLAFAPDGNPALAYHRCKIYDLDEKDCNPNVEAAVFAIYSDDDKKWRIKTIKEGDGMSCGTYTSLAFASDGTAHVAFQCTEEFMGVHSFALFAASKKF